MSRTLCNPYIWEDIRSVTSAFVEIIPPKEPCVSDLVNTIVCWYSLAILISGMLFVQGSSYAMYVFAFITILLLPSFIAYGRIVRPSVPSTSEGFRAEGFRAEGFKGYSLPPTAQVETPAKITYPTDRNPFMNVLLDEIKYNPTRPAAANVENKDVKLTLDDFFRVEFTSDPTDVFGRSQSQRQFITMPSTTVPNDQESYQNWLYKIPGKTCKEGGRDACLPGTDGGALPWLSVER